MTLLQAAVLPAAVLLLCTAGSITPLHAEDSATPAAPAVPGDEVEGTGLKLPRFVSLKSNAVNVRVGPSRNHPIVWRYKRASLPVEVVQEFETWRKIRDWEGAEGWVFQSLLSPHRTTIVMPWEKSKVPVEIRSSENGSRIVALVEPGVPAFIDQCDGAWCKIHAKEFSGWVEQKFLYGVYPDEKIK